MLFGRTFLIIRFSSKCSFPHIHVRHCVRTILLLLISMEDGKAIEVCAKAQLVDFKKWRFNRTQGLSAS